jgi:hypothetical protein
MAKRTHASVEAQIASMNRDNDQRRAALWSTPPIRDDNVPFLLAMPMSSWRAVRPRLALAGTRLGRHVYYEPAKLAAAICDYHGATLRGTAVARQHDHDRNQ